MKIAICTPVYSTVTAPYALSLARMVQHTAQAEIVFNKRPTKAEIDVLMVHSSVLPSARNELAGMALEWGANYLLWIDSDISFPKESLLRLLSLNLPVVGVNYPRRNLPLTPTAAGLDGGFLLTNQSDADGMKVEEVKSLGLGFCLIDMKVIRTLANQRVGGEPTPLFALEMLSDGIRFRGEDFHFFERIRSSGFPVHVDHHLSWAIGHWTFRELLNGELTG